MRAFLITCLAAGLALPAAAQTAGQRGEPEDIPFEEWRAMSEGRTLTYEIGGEVWARERYRPGTNEVRLQYRDGSCIEGVWDYEAPLYCFHWEVEGTSCFRHVRVGEEILVLETEDGVETGAVQTMTGVSDAPLACGPAVTS